MIDVYVCVGSACHIRGSYNIINDLQNLIEVHRVGDSVTVKAALCLGSCSQKVSVRVGEEGPVVGLLPAELEDFFQQHILPMTR